MSKKIRTSVNFSVDEDGNAKGHIDGEGDDLVRLAEELFDAVTENMTREECAALWRASIVRLLNAFHLDEEAAEMQKRLEEEEKANVSTT